MAAAAAALACGASGFASPVAPVAAVAFVTSAASGAPATQATPAASAASASPATQQAEAASGQHLFNGDTPLTGRIVGQDFALPSQASRCANCHVTEVPDNQAPTAAAAAARSRRFGPALTAAHLLEPSRRRGGPPSRYDRDTFCTLLRTGIDPAFVIIDRSMPRYELDTTRCLALWSYLTASP